MNRCRSKIHFLILVSQMKRKSIKDLPCEVRIKTYPLIGYEDSFFKYFMASTLLLRDLTAKTSNRLKNDNFKVELNPCSEEESRLRKIKYNQSKAVDKLMAKNYN